MSHEWNVRKVWFKQLPCIWDIWSYPCPLSVARLRGPSWEAHCLSQEAFLERRRLRRWGERWGWKCLDERWGAVVARPTSIPASTNKRTSCRVLDPKPYRMLDPPTVGEPDRDSWVKSTSLSSLEPNFQQSTFCKIQTVNNSSLRR